MVGQVFLNAQIFDGDSDEDKNKKTSKLIGMRTFFSVMAFFIAILTIVINGFLEGNI